MSSLEDVKTILTDTLQIGQRANSFTASTQLLGNLPELDSMAVVTIITALEQQFAFTIDDDEIDADTFETVGSLADFVDRKLQS